MRLILDTNTALSGLLWGGTPGRLMSVPLRFTCDLVSSEALIAELECAVSKRKFSKQLAIRGCEVADIVRSYRKMVTIASPAQIAPAIERDPDDDHVLAAALGAKADCIVTGDAHLLDLKRYLGIDIVTATVAVARLTSAR